MEICDHDTSCQFGERLLVHVVELCKPMEKLRTVLLLTLEYVSQNMCRDSSLYWTCVCVGVFFANSSANLYIPQPGGHLTTCSSSIEHVTVLCGFTLTPSSSVRQDCLFEFAQFARPLGMEELRQGLITCIIQRPEEQRSSAKPLERPSWSSRLAGAHERHAFEPQLWSSCHAGTRKAEGSAALPSGTDPRTGRRAPTQEPAISKAKSVSARCSVFSLSCPACAWSLLVPVRGFPGPAPSGSFLFWFRLVFLSTGRGRRVPAPSGRDVGSSARAPTQEPAFSRYPSLRSIF